MSELNYDDADLSYSASPSEDVSLLSTTETNGPELMTRSQAWNLYSSHLLSTWNMRMYEFAAVCCSPASVYLEFGLIATTRLFSLQRLFLIRFLQLLFGQ